jgi:hypothetical protein
MRTHLGNNQGTQEGKRHEPNMFAAFRYLAPKLKTTGLLGNASLQAQNSAVSILNERVVH